MANRKPEALKQVVIDGEATLVPAESRIVDVVPSEVTAVQVIDPAGKVKLLTRDQFKDVVPEGFTTYQTAVARGGG
jgi:hypothetical protein